MIYIDPYRFAVVGATYWNEADKHSGISVLGDDDEQALWASNGATVSAIRGSKSLTGSAKGYFEIATTADHTGAGEAALYWGGLGDLDANLTFNNGDPYTATDRAGKWVVLVGNSLYGTEAGSGGTHAGSGWASTAGVCVMGVAYDASTRQARMFDNGVERVTLTLGGTNPAFPYLILRSGISGTDQNGGVIRVLDAEFTYSVPEGYTAWASA